jgi:protein SCO1/2
MDSALERIWQTLHLPQVRGAASRPWLWSAGCGALLLVLLGGLVALHARGSTTTGASITTLQGTDLGGAPAPAFNLPDQNGKIISLSQFKGHPVVLTFFDSVCPHADCSLMAAYLNSTAQDMGTAETKEVDWVALSLNPWHDTQASATAFLSTRHMTMPLHFELGSLAQMAPLWSAYHMQSILQPNGVVIHTTGVYLLDQQGRERVFLDEGFDPHMLSNDVHLLLTNSRIANERSAAGASGSQSAAPGYVTLTRTSSAGVLTLIASPGQYGTYGFEVEAWEAQGVPAEGTASMDLSMTTMNMGVLHVPLSESGDGAPGIYSAHGVLSMEGGWQAIVTVTPGDGSPPIMGTFHFTAAY